MWATAQAHDAKGSPGASAQTRGGFQASLPAQVRTWPTATAGDANGSGSRNTPTSRAHAGVSLTDAVRGDGGTGRAWPTPSATMPNDTEDPQEWLARAAQLKVKHGNGNGAGMPLAVAAKLSQGSAWPTPAARDFKDTGTSPAEFERNTPGLAARAGGSLNADWVERLMGFPAGWTSPLTDGPQAPAKRSTKTKPRASRRSGSSDGNG